MYLGVGMGYIQARAGIVSTCGSGLSCISCEEWPDFTCSETMV